jgi:hypothetical protein
VVQTFCGHDTIPEHVDTTTFRLPNLGECVQFGVKRGRASSGHAPPHFYHSTSSTPAKPEDVSVKDCRVLVIVLIMGFSVGAGVAAELKEPPKVADGSIATAQGCHVWPLSSHPGASASWTGGCVEGNASGSGTFVSRWAEMEDRYTGDMRDGKANGHGSAVFAGGNKYEGEWRDGGANGQGALVFASGDRYEGNWHDGKANGQGTLLRPDGSRYEGEWTNNLRSGHGVIKMANEKRLRWRMAQRQAQRSGHFDNAVG